MKKWMKSLLAVFAVVILAIAGMWETGTTKNAEADTGVSQTEELQLTAKKKKKKNTATPTTAATATPAAETADVSEDTDTVTPTPVPEGPIIDPQSIADYIFANGELPENFITKKEAKALGWDSYVNYVSDVAPGMSIGGDYFGNYEGILPTDLTYHEADCNYTGGKRGAERIIYSNDGRVWYTADHYQTFTELFPWVENAVLETEENQ